MYPIDSVYCDQVKLKMGSKLVVFNPTPFVCNIKLVEKMCRWYRGYDDRRKLLTKELKRLGRHTAETREEAALLKRVLVEKVVSGTTTSISLINRGQYLTRAIILIRCLGDPGDRLLRSGWALFLSIVIQSIRKANKHRPHTSIICLCTLGASAADRNAKAFPFMKLSADGKSLISMGRNIIEMMLDEPGKELHTYMVGGEWRDPGHYIYKGLLRQRRNRMPIWLVWMRNLDHLVQKTLPTDMSADGKLRKLASGDPSYW